MGHVAGRVVCGLRRIALALFLAFAVAPARAQPIQAPAGMLPEVIVTAPGADGTVRTTPHGVSVISADEIRRSSSSRNSLGAPANTHAL